jgi:hypothetical protein
LDTISSSATWISYIVPTRTTQLRELTNIRDSYPSLNPYKVIKF